MKVELKAYPAYHAAESDWLGEMPVGWEAIQLARLNTKLTNGFVGPTRDILREEGVRYLQSLHIKGGQIIFDTPYYVSEEWSAAHQKSVLKAGDALIVQTGDIGQVATVTDEFAGCNCHALIIVCSKRRMIDGYFLSAVLRSHYGFHSLKSVQTGALHPHLNCTKIRDIFLPVPPLDDQRDILAFLDRETAKIDRLMEVRRKQVERLQEQRSAVIHHAVTQGLDPHAPMKPSGIEWLGDVPVHWRVVPLLDVLKERKVRNIGSQESNLLSLSYGRIIRKDAEDNFGLLPESFETYQIVEPGNIVVRLLDLQNDKRSLRVGYVEERGIVTSAYLALEAAPGQSPFYLSQLLHLYDLWKVFYGIGGGVRQSIGYTDIRRLPLPIPPLSEQVALTAAIKRANDKLDTLAAKYRRELELLAEYRASLISHAVTGKIDVRGLAELSPLSPL